MAGRPPPDDDPKFLAKLGAMRKAPRGGEVVSRSGPRRSSDEADDGPLDQDIERFSGVTRRCPECKKDVFDDSAVCYHCGHAFERTTSGSGRTPAWVIVTVIVLIAAFALTVALGLF